MGPIRWDQVDLLVKSGQCSVYDWCWVCGAELGPDKMHVLIDNGRLMRHTYCCRKHRYVQVRVATRYVLPEVDGTEHVLPGASTFMTQERTDLEIESLAMAFRAGELEPGWE
jgi:hypothetical protein